MLGVPPPHTLQFVIEVLRSLARSPSPIAIALAAVGGAAAYPQLRRTGQKSLFGLSPARSLAPPPRRRSRSGRSASCEAESLSPSLPLARSQGSLPLPSLSPSALWVCHPCRRRRPFLRVEWRLGMEERGEKSGRGRRERREEKRALSYWPVSHTHTEVDGHRTHIKRNGFTFV